jgi:CRISPR-associated protein Csm5
MPELAERYTVHMMTLCPMHVGTGTDLLQDYDYVVHGGRTWRIDEDALLDAALGEDDFDTTLLGRPAAELLQPEDYSAQAPFFRYVMQGTPRSQQKGARLREQIKDVYDRPYLPGSSLKGAFRTALFEHAVEQNPQALDVSRLKDRRRWAAQPVERAVLGRDPNHDLLRALHVADSEPLDPYTTLGVENVQVLTGRTPGSPIEVETLRPDARLRTQLTIDRFLFGEMAGRELRLGHRIEWLRDLMGLCRERVAPILAAERDWFHHQHPHSPIVGFYAQLYDYVNEMRDERCLLQVGWGGGWRSKTIGMKLDDRQQEQVIRRYRLARGRRRAGDPFPRSRRVVLNERGEPQVPLGWLLIEMKKEEGA